MTNSINGSQVEWRPEDVSDSVLLAVLLRAYHMFHLFQVHVLGSQAFLVALEST